MKKTVFATLLAINSFFVAYCFGFHMRSVEVVDPKLPPLANAQHEHKAKAAANILNDGSARQVQIGKHVSNSSHEKKIPVRTASGIGRSVSSKHRSTVPASKPHIAAMPAPPMFQPVPPYFDKWPGSPVQFTRRTISGVPFYETIVDLKDPDSFVKVGLEHDASEANSPTVSGGDEDFTALVSRNSGAVVCNGTFFSKDDQKRVMGNMVSGGKILKYSQWETAGTTLGIKAGNKLEMITAALQGKPDWNTYWFSITCGPRLLNHGEGTLNPEIEMFHDSHVLGIGPRVAIGFPESADKLILVTFLNGLSLDQEARLMKAIGCSEAMNLDGGASRSLAHDGKIVVPAGRPLTNVIVVYDCQYPAPSRLVDSWVQFQSRSSK